MDIIWNIVKCLEERAKELGIRNQLAGNFTVAYDELDDTFVDQSAVQNAVTTILKAVTKAEKAQDDKNIKDEVAGEQKAVAANKKADAKRKKEAEAAQKSVAAKKEFVEDIRECTGDTRAQAADEVKYKDGKFVIRIQGKNYYGKDYLELRDAVQKGIEKGQITGGKSAEAYLKKPAARKAA